MLVLDLPARGFQLQIEEHGFLEADGVVTIRAARQRADEATIKWVNGQEAGGLLLSASPIVGRAWNKKWPTSSSKARCSK